jgi:hypothetical protein
MGEISDGGKKHDKWECKETILRRVGGIMRNLKTNEPLGIAALRKALVAYERTF